jgi:uncharacterized membrane protein YhaH (DUF805 family)
LEEEVAVGVQHFRRARDEGAAARGRTNRSWYWLLAVPLVGVLIPLVYNTTDPRLIGIPFFYWYQMLWIPLSMLCTVTVYRKSRGER